MDLAQSILERARKEQIHPIPKVWFLVIRMGVALLFLITLLIGAIAIGLSLEALFPEHMSQAMMGKHGGHAGGRGMGFLQMTMGWLPLLWLIFTLGFTSLGLILFRKFRYGYRVRPSFILVGFFFASLLLGMISFQFQLSFRGHHALMMHVSPYRALFEEQRRAHWVDPQGGRIGGTVIANTDSTFTLQIWNGNSITVVNPDRPPVHTQIRVIGELCGEQFCATRIMPWQGGMGKHERHNYPSDRKE